METNVVLNHMPFDRYYEEVEYERRVISLMMQQQADEFVPESVSLDLWSGESDLREAWFDENHVY